jgi:dihydroorotase-like cyclic amidohydrolase
MSVSRIVKLCSSNPSRLIGRYPQKGALDVGSDADVTLVDLAGTRVVRDEELFTKVKWSPYAGRTLKGVPVATYSRGRLVVLNRQIVDDLPKGKYLEGIPQQMQGGAAIQSPALWTTSR